MNLEPVRFVEANRQYRYANTQEVAYPVLDYSYFVAPRPNLDNIFIRAVNHPPENWRPDFNLIPAVLHELGVPLKNNVNRQSLAIVEFRRCNGREIG
jgi:hypothetical protein